MHFNPMKCKLRLMNYILTVVVFYTEVVWIQALLGCRMLR